MYICVCVCVCVCVCIALVVKTGKWNGNPLQYSCLENSVDRGPWWTAVHRVRQNPTWLKRLSMHASIGEGNGNPLQYFLPGEFQGQRSLVGCQLWGHTESDDWSDLAAAAGVVKNLPANAGGLQCLGRESPLEEGMATHSSILASEIPWKEGLGGVQSMGLQRDRLDWIDLACMCVCTKWLKLQYLKI